MCYRKCKCQFITAVGNAVPEQPSQVLQTHWFWGTLSAGTITHQLTLDLQVILQHGSVGLRASPYLRAQKGSLREKRLLEVEELFFSPLPVSLTRTSGRAIKMGGWRLDLDSRGNSRG